MLAPDPQFSSPPRPGRRVMVSRFDAKFQLAIQLPSKRPAR